MQSHRNYLRQITPLELKKMHLKCQLWNRQTTTFQFIERYPNIALYVTLIVNFFITWVVKSSFRFRCQDMEGEDRAIPRKFMDQFGGH